MPVADTSALVALLDPADAHHRDARRELATGPIVVVRGALQEMAQVLRRRAVLAGQDGGNVARRAVDGIRLLDGFREGPHVDLATVCAMHKQETALSFCDAWSLATALQMGEPLATYDKALAAAHRRRSKPGG